MIRVRGWLVFVLGGALIAQPVLAQNEQRVGLQIRVISGGMRSTPCLAGPGSGRATP
jgi:hypothetical protein